MSVPPPPPLTSVQYLFAHNPYLRERHGSGDFGLPHLVSSFLDCSHLIPAAKHGNLEVLQYVVGENGQDQKIRLGIMTEALKGGYRSCIEWLQSLAWFDVPESPMETNAVKRDDVDTRGATATTSDERTPLLSPDATRRASHGAALNAVHNSQLLLPPNGQSVANGRSASCGELIKISVGGRRHAISNGQQAPRTPRSPFDAGFPMLFTSPLPSPRPHRLSFADERDDRLRELHVFLTLLMSVVGAGMLSVPYTFLLMPTWSALLGIVGVGVAMAVTSIALLYAHVQLAVEEEAVVYIGAGKRFSSFQSIAIAAGGPALGYIVSVVTAIGIYGGCVGCIRIVKDIAPFIISIIYPKTTESPEVAAHYADYLLWATFLLVVLPLCLLKNLSGLRVSSYLGFAFSLYLVAAVIYRSFVKPTLLSPLGDDLSTPPTAAQPRPETAATLISGSAFSRTSQAISIYNYAFMMQLNLIPLFIQLRGSFTEPLPRTRTKMIKSISGVSGFCVVLYALFGVFAKRLYDTKIRGNILLNLENDPVMAVPLVAVFLTVVLSFPLLFHPLRGVIEELLFFQGGHGIETISFFSRTLTTTVLLLSQLVLALGRYSFFDYIRGASEVYKGVSLSFCSS
ncbi:hypothetical protein ATCC90586_004762 [Pythium insidiosum]|nr:hypothetical protein ATCC90586_004762 [Pythium insidiosum]